MATYTKSKGGSVGGGSDKTFEFDAITIPASEQFYRCKVQKSGSYTGSCVFRGNAQSVFGADWNTWSTNKTGISWSKSGDAPKVKVHNNDSTSHSWTLTVTLETQAKPTYAITISSGTGGTVTADKSSTYEGATVTLTVTPAANYYLTSLTVKKGSTNVTVTNNKFTMPGGAVTVTATWAMNSFAITKVVSPSGAGTITGPSSASPGQSITFTQTASTGYTFKGWSVDGEGMIPGNLGMYMPAKNITVTANYMHRSTGSLSPTSVQGGGTATLTITAESTAYSHKYRLYKSGTSMDTGWISVAAGTKTVTVSIPNWNSYVTTATSATGLVLELQTYNGSTQVGNNYTVSNAITYNVPETVRPTVTAISPTVARTIGGITYANVGDVYVQRHCGVTFTVSASGAGGSTISSIVVTLSGYSGASYTKTVSNGGTYTSGLLTNAGSTTITVTATDSRGRTGSAPATITVEAYSAPAGTLSVWRTDVDGEADDVGEYGKYSLTDSYTEVGNNAWLTRRLEIVSPAATENDPADSGNLMPSSREQFLTTNEYTVKLTLQDKFETTVISTKLPTAKFILYVDEGGDRIGFMKAVNKEIPTGKTSTVEFSEDSEIYVGDELLVDYIFNSRILTRQVSTTQGYCILTGIPNNKKLLVQNVYRTGAKLNSSFTVQPDPNNNRYFLYIRDSGEIPVDGTIYDLWILII